MRARRAQSNIRSQVSSHHSVQRIQPFPKRVAFFDVFTFAAVFFSILFNSLNQRSIIFDIVIGIAMLLKVIIGVFFYQKNNTRSLRLYFIFRYLYNIVVVYPIIIILKFYSKANTINYFLAAGILLACELIITLCQVRYLCVKRPIEALEDIPGFKIMSYSEKAKKMVINISAKDSANYIRKQIGDNQAEKITDQRIEQAKKVKEREMKKRKGNGVKTDVTAGDDDNLVNTNQNGDYVFDFKRPEEEIEAEKLREEIQQSRLSKNKQQYLALQPSINKVVVNDVTFYEYKQIQAEQEVKKEIIYGTNDELRRLKSTNYKLLYDQSLSTARKIEKEVASKKAQENPKEIIAVEQIGLEVKDDYVQPIMTTENEDVEDQNDSQIESDEEAQARQITLKGINTTQVKSQAQGNLKAKQEQIPNKNPQFEIKVQNANSNYQSVVDQPRGIPNQQLHKKETDRERSFMDQKQIKEMYSSQQRQQQQQKQNQPERTQRQSRVEKINNDKNDSSSDSESSSNDSDRGNIPVQKQRSRHSSNQKKRNQKISDSSYDDEDDDDDFSSDN